MSESRVRMNHPNEKIWETSSPNFGMHIKSHSVQEKFAIQVLFGRIFPPTRSWVWGKHYHCFGRTMCFFCLGWFCWPPFSSERWIRVAPECIWQVSLQILEKKTHTFPSHDFQAQTSAILGKLLHLLQFTKLNKKQQEIKWIKVPFLIILSLIPTTFLSWKKHPIPIDLTTQKNLHPRPKRHFSKKKKRGLKSCSQLSFLVAAFKPLSNVCMEMSFSQIRRGVDWG